MFAQIQLVTIPTAQKNLTRIRPRLGVGPQISTDYYYTMCITAYGQLTSRSRLECFHILSQGRMLEQSGINSSSQSNTVLDICMINFVEHANKITDSRFGVRYSRRDALIRTI